MILIRFRIWRIFFTDFSGEHIVAERFGKGHRSTGTFIRYLHRRPDAAQSVSR
jgi:hypothetical protein